MMEVVDNILDAIHEEVSWEEGEDVEMMDVEEGEVLEGPRLQQNSNLSESDVKAIECDEGSQRAKNMNRNKRKKKNKNRKRKSEVGTKGVDVDRFVLDSCKRLKERKSYLVYTAIGVLGVSAVSDLVKEVDAVQACGGQKTADGYRFRTGGGILWNILKVRDPNAYKEIMKKGKDFEKQFKRPKLLQTSTHVKNAPEKADSAVTSKASVSVSEDDHEVENPEEGEQPLQPITNEKRKSVHDRLRVPVSYDDLIGNEPHEDQCS